LLSGFLSIILLFEIYGNVKENNVVNLICLFFFLTKLQRDGNGGKNGGNGVFVFKEKPIIFKGAYAEIYG